MPLSWHFLDLSPEQKQARRHHLDHYAFIAQISVFVPLLLLQVYFLVTWISGRLTRDRHGESDVPSSSIRKERMSEALGFVDKVKYWKRRTVWWAGEPIEFGDWYVARKGEVIVGLVWMIWLLGLCVAQTGDGEYEFSCVLLSCPRVVR